jgi:hypothetical protein
MTIAATAITIDGDTAWLAVEYPAPLGKATIVSYRELDRPCDRCHGTGRMLEDDASRPTCPDCHGTGRHTFTIDVECEWCVGYGYLLGAPDHYEAGSDAVIPCTDDDGEECNDGSRSISVHVVEVLGPITEVAPGVWTVRGNVHVGNLAPLPEDAADGMYAVRLAVHT